ncbi:RNA polymerase sigma factor [Actinophytocola sediminis]
MSPTEAVYELVDRARQGEQAAWDQLVERFSPLVWSVCRRFRLIGGDAEDVAASVWLRLVERLDTIREPAALPGWIATTTARECLRVQQSRNRHVLLDDERLTEEGTQAVSDEWLLEQERHIALRAAFAELSQRCRRLLSLVFGEPPTPYRQIADELGMTVGGIGPTRMRCLDKVRESPAVAALMDASPTGGR